MNTPAHAVLNLVLLDRSVEPRRTVPVLIGAVVPDLPIIGFYAYERLCGMPETWIWQTGYYDPRWQAVFDVVHSFPLVLAALAVAVRVGWPRLALGFASMALHAVGDFLVHHDDAHRHFFPLLDWRFASPVSYWDPRHFGNLVAPLETIGVLAGCLLLARRAQSVSARAILAGLAAIYLVYVGYAVWMWAEVL